MFIYFKLKTFKFKYRKFRAFPCMDFVLNYETSMNSDKDLTTGLSVRGSVFPEMPGIIKKV